MTKINEYIQSGTLEAYCIGMVSASEKREVERLYAKSKVIQTEVEAIRRSLEYYVSSFQLTPPTYLKNRILDSIENLDISIVEHKVGRQH